MNGCIPVVAPDSPVGELQPRIITLEQSRFIQDGVITKEQVLLALGEPDYWWDHERVFAYHWATSDIASLFPLPIAPIGERGPLGMFIKYNYLLVAFDDAGRVQRHARQQHGLLHRVALDEFRKHWTASEGKP